MKKYTHIALIAFAFPSLFVAGACSSTASLPKGERVGEEVQPQTPVHFAVVQASPQEYFGKPILVEGTVKAVCQKMGCWMQIEDGGHLAIVRWKDGCGGKYAFAKDAAGRKVLVQGVLSPNHMEETETEHFKLDNADVVVHRDCYVLDATSVIYIDEGSVYIDDGQGDIRT
jgi:hypothetical protein